MKTLLGRYTDLGMCQDQPSKGSICQQIRILRLSDCWELMRYGNEAEIMNGTGGKLRLVTVRGGTFLSTTVLEMPPSRQPITAFTGYDGASCAPRP